MNDTLQLAMKECKNRIEVICNIHDNPELLEVGEHEIHR